MSTDLLDLLSPAPAAMIPNASECMALLQRGSDAELKAEREKLTTFFKSVMIYEGCDVAIQVFAAHKFSYDTPECRAVFAAFAERVSAAFGDQLEAVAAKVFADTIGFGKSRTTLIEAGEVIMSQAGMDFTDQLTLKAFSSGPVEGVAFNPHEHLECFDHMYERAPHALEAIRCLWQGEGMDVAHLGEFLSHQLIRGVIILHLYESECEEDMKPIVLDLLPKIEAGMDPRLMTRVKSMGMPMAGQVLAKSVAERWDHWSTFGVDFDRIEGLLEVKAELMEFVSKVMFPEELMSDRED